MKNTPRTDILVQIAAINLALNTAPIHDSIDPNCEIRIGRLDDNQQRMHILLHEIDDEIRETRAQYQAQYLEDIMADALQGSFWFMHAPRIDGVKMKELEAELTALEIEQDAVNHLLTSSMKLSNPEYMGHEMQIRNKTDIVVQIDEMIRTELANLFGPAVEVEVLDIRVIGGVMDIPVI